MVSLDGTREDSLEVRSLHHLAAADERPPEGDLVGVLEVAADREAAGEAGYADAAAQTVGEVRRSCLARHVRIRGEHDLLHAVSIDAVQQLVDPQARRLDSVEGRQRAAE